MNDEIDTSEDYAAYMAQGQSDITRAMGNAPGLSCTARVCLLHSPFR